MKKFLSFLGAVSLSAITTTSIIACNKIESNNLSKIKKIDSPVIIKTNQPNEVPEIDIINSLKSNVLDAVKKIVSSINEDEFIIKIAKNKDGEEYEPVDIQENEKQIYVQINPSLDKTAVVGKSKWISVFIQKENEILKEKINIDSIVIPKQSLAFKSLNPLLVTDSELLEINENENIKKIISSEIEKIAPEAIINTDYIITNDAQPGNFESSKEINLTVSSVDTSEVIQGKFNVSVEIKGSNILNY